jgi:hypothetical protein
MNDKELYMLYEDYFDTKYLKEYPSDWEIMMDDSARDLHLKGCVRFCTIPEPGYFLLNRKEKTARFLGRDLNEAESIMKNMEK